jgi:hypothetical protein
MKLDQKINRQNALDQGYYDGRFRPKVVKDKKKEKSKREARTFKYTA